MKIQADKEGLELIKQLLDLALKQGGLQNLQAVQAALAGMEELKEDKEKQEP